MKKQDIIRAWRDSEFYASLSEEDRAALPMNPAALPDVEDDVLNSVAGGCISVGGSGCPTSSVCTPCPPFHCSA